MDNMVNNKKKKYLIIIGLVLVALIGVTFAYFNYYNETSSKKLLAGDVYLNMDDTGGFLLLSNIFPETPEEARSRNDNIVTFTIDGRNSTTNKTIWYEIMLDEGDNDNSFAVKIRPEHLRFDLSEVINGEKTLIVDNQSYTELNSTRIWVDQVDPGTLNISREYELRVWLDEDVLISTSDPFADYPANTWSSTYASVKVSVYGDFEEKTLTTPDSNETPATCFTYQETTVGPTNSYTYLYKTATINTSDEAVAICMDYTLNTINGGRDISDAGDGYLTYCQGTGTWWDATFEQKLSSYGEEDIDYLVNNGVLTNYNEETRYYTLNTNDTAVNTCMDYMLNIVGGDHSDAGDGYDSFCKGTGTFGDQTFESWLQLGEFYQPEVDYFVANGVLTELEPTVGLEITDYNASCGTDVIIPSQINGMDVVGISINDDTGSAFYDKGLTSVVFPNTMIYINNEAFWNNNITTLEIPSSVTSIGERAFQYNPLVKVNVKGNPSLGDSSFLASDDNYPSGSKFEAFKYGGTCAELNQYASVISSEWNTLSHPALIITKDGYSCVYNNYGIPL